MGSNFKEDMFNAIGLIGKPKEVKKPERKLLEKLNDRLKYIQNKVNTSDFVNLLNKYLEVDSSLDKQVIQTSNNEYKIQLSKKS